MRKIDLDHEEDIRRWPVWLARLFNRVIGWTSNYCSAGCGYPVTGSFNLTVDHIDDAPVLFLVCSLGGDCERNVLENPVDSKGMRYSDIRPMLVTSHKEASEKPEQIVLSLTK